MHLRDARKAGEPQERLDLVAVRRESPVFTARERAALAWTEALVADSHVPDGVCESVRAEFSEQELVDLTMAVVAINGWNRMMVSFRIRRPPCATIEDTAVHSVPGLGRHLLKPGAIPDLDATALDVDRRVTAEVRQNAAYRLYGQPEMIGHVGAAHRHVQDACSCLR